MAEQPDRSQNFGVSKSKVKFDFSTVRSRVLPILKGIEVKMYPAKIGRARGWSKQHVDYYVKKMEKAGLIRRLKHSNFVDYELTENGQNFLISVRESSLAAASSGCIGVSSSFQCCEKASIHRLILGG